MGNRYDDIICLPHPVSLRHPPIPGPDRAAQFAPFAALTGFEAEILETGRLTQLPPELTDSSIQDLDVQLQYLSRQQSPQSITVTWFQPDVRKSGGSYVTRWGLFKRVDAYARQLLLQDGTNIPLDAIVAIEPPGREDWFFVNSFSG